MSDLLITAPNGAVYRFRNMGAWAHQKAVTDEEYRNSLLVIAHARKMVPVSGAPYVPNGQGVPLSRPILVPRDMNRAPAAVWGSLRGNNVSSSRINHAANTVSEKFACLGQQMKAAPQYIQVKNFPSRPLNEQVVHKPPATTNQDIPRSNCVTPAQSLVASNKTSMQQSGNSGLQSLSTNTGSLAQRPPLASAQNQIQHAQSVAATPTGMHQSKNVGWQSSSSNALSIAHPPLTSAQDKVLHPKPVFAGPTVMQQPRNADRQPPSANAESVAQHVEIQHRTRTVPELPPTAAVVTGTQQHKTVACLGNVNPQAAFKERVIYQQSPGATDPLQTGSVVSHVQIIREAAQQLPIVGVHKTEIVKEKSVGNQVVSSQGGNFNPVRFKLDSSFPEGEEKRQSKSDMSHTQEILLDGSDNESTLSEGSQDTSVYVSNLPHGCSEKELSDCVTLNMHLNGLADAPGNPVVKCSIDNTAGEGVLELRSFSEKTKALVLDGLDLKGSALKLSMNPEHSWQKGDCTSLEKTTKTSCHKKSTNDGFWCPDATHTFIKEMILWKDNLTGNRSQQMIAYQAIFDAMENNGYSYSIDKLQKKRKSLEVYYRARKKQKENKWKFFNLMAQFMGDLEFNGEFAEIVQRDDGVLWTHETTLALIDAFAKRAHLFEAAHRPQQLWQEIQGELFQAHPLNEYTWGQCESKWKRLKEIYLDFKQQLRTSGSGSAVVEWVYYDPMDLILRESVSADPKYTLSGGTHYDEQYKKGNKKSGSTAKKVVPEKEVCSKKKKPRLSNVARKLEIEEKKLSIQCKLIQSLNKMIRKKKKKKNATPSSSSDEEDSDEEEDGDD